MKHMSERMVPLACVRNSRFLFHAVIRSISDFVHICFFSIFEMVPLCILSKDI